MKKIFTISAILIIILLFDFYLYDSWLNLSRYTFRGDFSNICKLDLYEKVFTVFCIDIIFRYSNCLLRFL